MLNLVEMLLLLTIGLMAVPTFFAYLARIRADAGGQNIGAGDNSLALACTAKSAADWFTTHADSGATTVAFMYPIRLIVGVFVSCILMTGGLASIDYTAMLATQSIESLEQSYPPPVSHVIVPSTVAPEAFARIIFQCSLIEGFGSVKATHSQLKHVLLLPRSRYNNEYVPLMRDGLGDLLTALSEEFGGEPLEYHNPYFDSGAELSARSERPFFNVQDADCPCSTVSALLVVGRRLGEHMWAGAVAVTNSGQRRRRLQRSHSSSRRTLQGIAGCPPNATVGEDSYCYCQPGFTLYEGVCTVFQPGDACPGVPNAYISGDGKCYCDQHHVVHEGGCVDGGLLFELEAIRDLLQDPETGVVTKCTVQLLRELWEPIPFCMRYAGIVSILIAAMSMVVYHLPACLPAVQFDYRLRSECVPKL